MTPPSTETPLPTTKAQVRGIFGLIMILSVLGVAACVFAAIAGPAASADFWVYAAVACGVVYMVATIGYAWLDDHPEALF